MDNDEDYSAFEEAGNQVRYDASQPVRGENNLDQNGPASFVHDYLIDNGIFESGNEPFNTAIAEGLILHLNEAGFIKYP